MQSPPLGLVSTSAHSRPKPALRRELDSGLQRSLPWLSNWNLRSGGNKELKVDCCWSITVVQEIWSTAQGLTLFLGLIPRMGVKCLKHS